MFVKIKPYLLSCLYSSPPEFLTCARVQDRFVAVHPTHTLSYYKTDDCLTSGMLSRFMPISHSRYAIRIGRLRHSMPHTYGHWSRCWDQSHIGMYDVSQVTMLDCHLTIIASDNAGLSSNDHCKWQCWIVICSFFPFLLSILDSIYNASIVIYQ